jgi:hypothetical protein
MSLVEAAFANPRWMKWHGTDHVGRRKLSAEHLAKPGGEGQLSVVFQRLDEAIKWRNVEPFRLGCIEGWRAELAGAAATGCRQWQGAPGAGLSWLRQFRRTRHTDQCCLACFAELAGLIRRSKQSCEHAAAYLSQGIHRLSS